MDYLGEAKKAWKNFPKVKAEEDAFYSVFKYDGCYFVTMYYRMITAKTDAQQNGGKVVCLSQLKRCLGTGKTFFFHNFYLS